MVEEEEEKEVGDEEEEEEGKAKVISVAVQSFTVLR